MVNDNRQTILIVDDAKMNAKILASLLSDQARLKFALSGHQALEMITKEQPDLILLDVIMPELSGYEVCKALKEDPLTRDIPIIFVTSLSDEEDEEEGLQLGAIDYIIKPFKPAIVKARVSNILKLQAAQQELRQANTELTRVAMTDSLTGAANRRHFLEMAQKEVTRSQRSKSPIGVVMADIDHFKSINDTHGHDVGDKALIKTVEVIQETLRNTDLLGRLGGEEFAIYLPETDAQGTQLISNRLREAIGAIRIELEGQTLSFTCSFGAHVIDAGSESIEEALKKSDEALYFSKQNGRNRVTLFDDLTNT